MSYVQLSVILTLKVFKNEKMAKQASIEPTGNPLDLEDKEYSSIVLTTDTMNVKIEGKFRQRERKLFVLLVHAVWGEIGTKRQHTVEIEKIKRVFREIANVRSFNDWLWEYLENLAEIKITYRTEHLRGITRLFSDVFFDEKKEHVTFEIPQTVERAIKSPTQYARLDTYFLLGLKGKYSVSLYQLLESKINLNKFKPHRTPNGRDRFVEITISELRDWLGVGSMYSAWKDLNRRVLQPAVDEINSNPLASTFTVRTEEVRGARKKVKSIKFFLTKTPERLRLENSIQVTKEAKTAARKSSLIPAFKGTEIYDKARKIIPQGHDLHSLEEEWRDYSYRKNEAVKYPEKAWLKWLEKKFSKEERSNNTGFLGSLFGRFSANE